jgi:transcriptional regulator
MNLDDTRPGTDSNTIGLSQLEIARRLGISRARVSFLERQALQKMRAMAEANGWELDDVLRDVYR